MIYTPYFSLNMTSIIEPSDSNSDSSSDSGSDSGSSSDCSIHGSYTNDNNYSDNSNDSNNEYIDFIKYNNISITELNTVIFTKIIKFS